MSLVVQGENVGEHFLAIVVFTQSVPLENARSHFDCLLKELKMWFSFFNWFKCSAVLSTQFLR